MALLRKFLKSEDGATVIEYGLIVAAIALSIVVSAETIGVSLQDVFDEVNTYFPTS